MEKKRAWRTLLTAAAAAVSAYAGEIAAPIAVLGCVMALDYCTGVAAAWVTKSLSSRVGLMGIVKKAAYLSLVAVGMTMDYVAAAAGEELGMQLPVEYLFGLMVCIWLIINECISILENADRLGLPVPPFAEKLLLRLRERTESTAEGGAEEP